MLLWVEVVESFSKIQRLYVMVRDRVTIDTLHKIAVILVWLTRHVSLERRVGIILADRQRSGVDDCVSACRSFTASTISIRSRTAIHVIGAGILIHALVCPVKTDRPDKPGLLKRIKIGTHRPCPAVCLTPAGRIDAESQKIRIIPAFLIEMSECLDMIGRNSINRYVRVFWERKSAKIRVTAILTRPETACFPSIFVGSTITILTNFEYLISADTSFGRAGAVWRTANTIT
jgi:hypothetical protein